MTLPATTPPVVFDTTSLSHFARADRLDVLADLLAGKESLIPHVVREEIRHGAGEYPELQLVLNAPWLKVLQLDTLAQLQSFARWSRRIGSGERDLGEAGVLAAAEESGGVALIDDREAVKVGRAYGVHVHGTVWLLATACREGRLTEFAASNLIDGLSASGMWLPCGGTDFPRFAESHGLFGVLPCDKD